ncbi:MAG: GGDEF-domain containing protein [Micavibrio sp.]|nr:GGDEF-domain containing protein [Micavibrio sp.]
MEAVSYVENKSKVKDHKSKAKFVSSPVQIWKSKISWKITLAAFMTILLIQTCILNFSSMGAYETERLNQLREIGRSSVVPILNYKTTQLLTSPFDVNEVNRLLSITRVAGLTVYGVGLDGETLALIRSYGEGPVITLYDQDNISKTYRSTDGGRYEFVTTGNGAAGSYYLVIRMDASHIQPELFSYVKQTIFIMLLLSAFVTTVLMIALGHWLLEPILFLRDNLQMAVRDPENPQLEDSPYDPNDEIGAAIDIAFKVVKQNADNLTRIKSAAEDKIHKLAYYDTLTGLPNRTLFVQTLSEKARKAAAEGHNNERFAVVTVDLDHFKDINDSMGHNVGDAILRGVAKRLRSAMPEAAMVSRSGEDEYAIMMPLTGDVNSAREVADKIAHVIRYEPFRVFNEEFQVRSSIGVATYPDDGIEPDQVLKNADIALNRAKEDGRDTIKEYSEDFDRAVQVRFQMLRDLRDAMEHDQLELFYQPQLDLKTGEIIGAEALLRWWKPDNSKEGGAYISPGDFIPVAEQSGLIVPMGEWVMKSACYAVKDWKEKHGLDVRVAVNVSPAQFIQSDLCAYVQQLIEETGIEPKMLELEVTESVFMDDIQHTIQTLQNLHAIGVELAIDDFGTGYSSLSYLRQFPIDRLKIDQSFIRNALNDPDDASIARTIIALGRSLGLKVIAEGVETLEHEKFLIDEGCDEVQGFRYSRPVPLADFLEFAGQYDGKLASFAKS